MPPRLVILVGPPACGKGTHARLLQNRRGWRAFSTGAAIRAHVQSGSPIGQRCRSLLASAYLLPDSLIMDLVRMELQDHTGGLVLDGFPRTLPQAESFRTYCQERAWKMDLVVLFDGSESDLAPRVTRRLTCVACGGTFRLLSGGEQPGPSNREAHVVQPHAPCPRCGHTLERRRDDTPEIFHQRFEEYKLHTLPLIPFFAKHGVVLRVSALDGENQIASAIDDALESRPE